MKRSILIIPIIISIFSATAFCSGYSEDNELSDLFNQKGIKGTILISTLSGDTSLTANRKRAHQPFLPASTFKIPNTLIALQTGAIKDETEIIPWDGKKRFVPAWNKDQNLQTAFSISCVWFYQELAKRVGNHQYLEYLKLIDYGNHATGDDVTTFWLAGDLRISANEQIEFLKSLYRVEMPFDKNHYRILKKIMIVKQTEDYTLRAKTGWTARIDQQIGWYVGYVETESNIWFFATNLDITDESYLIHRKGITMEALKVTGIIPEDASE